MGKILAPQPAKLICGFIFKEPLFIIKTEELLSKKFGRIDFSSPIMEFNNTEYYTKEFGEGLKRKFISFKRLCLPDNLADIKIFTNKIERRFTFASFRKINIDPGYLNQAKLVLASTKDYVHRIYLSKGIYAETTLFYEFNTFTPWKWSYPDYRSREYIQIFNSIRGIYAEQLKALGY